MRRAAWVLGLLASLPSCEEQESTAPPAPRVSGCLEYENRRLTSEGLSAVQVSAAPELRIELVAGEQVLGTSALSPAGCFSLAAPTTLPPKTHLRASTWREDAPGRGVVVARRGSEGSGAGLREWSWTSEGDGSCGQEEAALRPARDGWQVSPWRIPVACGAGAIAVFAQLDAVAARVVSWGVDEGPDLVAVWEPGVRGCGACLREAEPGVEVAGRQFSAWIELSGREDTPMHWAPSVIAHEAGHWALRRLGGLRSEPAGAHSFTSVLPPGQAFREGWATAFAQRHLSRLSSEGAPQLASRYVTQQLDQIYWVDLDAPLFSGGPLPALDPALSRGQPINEFVVASAIWRLWTSTEEGDEPRAGLGDRGVLAAVRAASGATGEPELGDLLDAAACLELAPSRLSEVARRVGLPWSGAVACPPGTNELVSSESPTFKGN